MKYQIDVLSKKQKLILSAFLCAWTAVNTAFFVWWFNSDHIVTIPLFVLNTAVLFWTYLLPAYFFFFAIRMKKPNPNLKLPTNWRVAMIVTKVPSEPLFLLQKTLLGMLAQDYPHDTWLADEDPTKETIKWCQKHNVKVSSRRGISAYHNEFWPRRTKCKEGNLMYFYDTWGYEMYDFVVQLDADHIPQKNYLKNMLIPFLDLKVGYVSAPSICGNNAKESWAARARLYSEGLLHGAQQAGHSNGFAPLCFGSHYAVRTKALKQIGGIGPELAEDHSTSMIMNANGWKGVHALDALALGDGPATFADAMKQEFQWSRSLMNLLLMWTHKYISGLPLHLKFQFVFAQMWYILYSSMMLVGIALPIYAIIFNTPLVSVSYISFLGIHILNIFTTLSVVLYLKHLKMLRPIDAKPISWEMIIFNIAKWPWTLMGVTSSIYDMLLKREFKFKVTPKDQTGYQPLNFSVISPYVLVILFYFIVGAIFNNSVNALGYYYFFVTGITMYLAVLFVIVYMHNHEQKH